MEYDLKNREWENWQKIPTEKIKGFLRDDNLWGQEQGVNNPGRKKIREIIQTETEKLGRPLDILEVGCGTGIEYEGMRKNGLKINYTGVDVTPKMIEVAREFFKDAHFELGDIFNLQFQDKSFDLVFIRHVLEHLPEYQKPISELYRVSKKILIIDFFLTPIDTPTEIVIRKTRIPNPKEELQFYHNRFCKLELVSFIKSLGTNELEVMEYLLKVNNFEDTIYKITKKD